jgi:PAS domain S-box-containing protein
MKIVNTIFKSIVTVAVVFTVYFIPTSSFAAENPYAGRTVVIKSDWNYPPFEYLNDKGIPEGFDVDLLKAFMKKMDVKYKLELGYWADIYRDAQSGKLDLIMGIVKTPQRAGKFIFSDSYAKVQFGIVVNTDLEGVVKNKKCKVLAYKDNAFKDKLTKRYSGYDTVSYMDNPLSTLLCVENGSMDAAFGNYYTLKYYILKNGLSNLEISKYKYVPTYDLCFASRDPEMIALVNEGIAKLKADGTYQEIYDKWFSGNIERYGVMSQSLKLWIAVVCLLVAIVVVGSVFIYYLRRRVQSAVARVTRQNDILTLSIAIGNLNVWTYDVKSHVFTVLFGNSKCSNFLDLRDSVHPDDVKIYEDFVESVLSGEKLDNRKVVRFRNNDNSGYVYIDIIVRSTVDRQGSVVSAFGVNRDVTGVYKSEIEISHQKDLLQTIYDNIPIGLYLNDATGKVLKVNNFNLKNFGTNDEEDLIGVNLFDDPDLSEEVKQKLRRGESVSYQMKVDFKTNGKYYRSILPTGTKIFNVSTVVVRDKNGKIYRYLSMFQDVTRSLSERHMLEDYKRRTDVAVRGAGIVLWEFDRKSGNYISYNEPINNYDDSKKLLMSDYLNVFHPDDVEAVLVNYKGMERGDKITLTQSVRVHIPGSYGWRHCEITVSPFEIDADGKVSRYVGVRRDNTRFVELNQQISGYVDKINYIIAESHLLLFDYDLATHCITLRSGDDYICTFTVEEYIERIYAPDREELREFAKRLDNREFDRYEAHRRVLSVSGDGSIRYVKVNCVAMRDDKGVITSYSGLRTDMTDIVELQHGLEKAKLQAETADRLKSAFLANMSHEIRTPLNAIVGFSELLGGDDVLPEDKTEYVNIINSNSDLLLRLINDILDLSKIESGMLEYKSEEFDWAKYYDDLVRSLGQRKRNEGVAYVVDHPYSTCIIVQDKNRMAQIITNFATNAIKYTASGEVHLGYEVVDGGVKLWSRDTGIGIAKEKQDRIFRRFEKLDDFAQGTGLGLSICKAIVDELNGKIGFESELGKGSLFWAWIPCGIKRIVEKDASKDNKTDTDIK